MSLAAAIDGALTEARIRRVSALLLLAHAGITAAAIGAGPRAQPALPDLVARLAGGALVLRGRAGDLYDPAAQRAVEAAITGDPGYLNLYISPPFVALLYAPLAALPYAIAALAWTAICLALLAAAARLARPLLPALARDRWGTALLAAAAAQPVLETLGSGQDAALSALIWIAGARLALSRRDVAAGVVLGLGAFKPQLFIVAPLLLLALRRFRAAAACLATFAALGALSLALVGPQGITAWIGLLRSPLYAEGVRAAWRWKMHSLAPFLESLAPGGRLEVIEAARAAGLLAGAALLVATAVLVARRRRQANDERVAWALGAVAAALASPHLLVHDLTLLLWPAALLVELGAPRRARLLLLGVALLTWTGPVRALVTPDAWPLSLLAVSWTPPLLLLVWRELARELAAQRTP